MNIAITETVRRAMEGPNRTLRVALTNAMFVILVAKELVLQPGDEN